MDIEQKTYIFMMVMFSLLWIIYFIGKKRKWSVRKRFNFYFPIFLFGPVIIFGFWPWFILGDPGPIEAWGAGIVVMPIGYLGWRWLLKQYEMEEKEEQEKKR